MRYIKKLMTWGVGLGALLVAVSSQAAVIPISTECSSPYDTCPGVVDIPGLSAYQTHGDDMNGLLVTATFATATGGQVTDSFIWGDLGINWGGGVGTANPNWGLSLNGDSFSNVWEFTNATGMDLLTLTLDALNSLTVFDMINSPEVTAGSALGGDFYPVEAHVGGSALYKTAVGVGGDDPLGDLWKVVVFTAETVGGGPGVAGDFTFYQDTDNDSRYVPEPTGLALMGLGLLGLGYMRKRHSVR